MSVWLSALLLVMLVPLFVASWRTSLAGLAGQGLLMAWMVQRQGPHPDSVAAWLTLVDLGLLRGVAVPLVFYAVLRWRRSPPRNDVIPPNLMSWALALGLVLISFSAAERLGVEPGDARQLVAVASAGVLLGFLVLASQTGPLSQMVGALRIENAIALLELGSHSHATALWLRVSLMITHAATVALFARYLLRLTERAAPAQA